MTAYLVVKIIVIEIKKCVTSKVIYFPTEVFLCWHPASDALLFIRHFLLYNKNHILSQCSSFFDVLIWPDIQSLFLFPSGRYIQFLFFHLPSLGEYCHNRSCSFSDLFKSEHSWKLKKMKKSSCCRDLNRRPSEWQPDMITIRPHYSPCKKYSSVRQ